MMTGQPANTLGHADTLYVAQLLHKGEALAKHNGSAALKKFEEAMGVAEQLNYSSGAAKAALQAGIIYTQQRSYIQAVNLLEKAKEYYAKLKDDYHLAQALKKLGDVYAARSYFRQSSDCYREAAPLLRATGQQAVLSECIDGMGSIAASVGRYKNATVYFNRSLAIKQKLNDRQGIVTTTERLAVAYMNGKQYDSALYFLEAVKLLAPGDPYLQSTVLSNQSIIYCFLKKNKQAAEMLALADKTLPAENNTDEKIKLVIARAVYSMATDDKARTKKFFDSAGSLMTGSRNPELTVAGFDYLAEMSTLKDDYKTAYHMLRQGEVFKDLYRTSNIDRMKAVVENAAELGLKEKEIQYLNLVARLKAAQISRDELQRMALLRENILKDSSLAGQQLLMEALQTETELRGRQLQNEKELSQSLSRENMLKQKMLTDEQHNRNRLWAVLSVISLLGAVIFFQYRKQRRKNAIINRQSAELEVLNKEIHHRVKNNLQVISSMLDLQSQSLKDPHATAIIKEGIQRVQSMAFIHQNLYQGSEANAVNMTEYIRMLSNHLFQTYNIREGKIRMHTDIQELKLHTDTAIPLGMILNELISNALKYAFRGREEGSIRVVMKLREQELLLQVKDNGVGLPATFDLQQANTFGYDVIKAFARKMKARMNIDGSNGTDVQIIISKFKTVQS